MNYFIYWSSTKLPFALLFLGFTKIFNFISLVKISRNRNSWIQPEGVNMLNDILWKSMRRTWISHINCLLPKKNICRFNQYHLSPLSDPQEKDPKHLSPITSLSELQIRLTIFWHNILIGICFKKIYEYITSNRSHIHLASKLRSIGHTKQSWSTY